MAKIFLGIVADDFTGASDAASFLVEAGVSTVLFSGVPQEITDIKDDTEAIVVALKTRTMPTEQAVEESMEAFRWLKKMGAEQLYLKYCSTFDSTEKGNIGPVVDAVLDQWNYSFTVLCPSLPVNGRTVLNGNLYVNGVLLEESHMKDHPLTPMRDSNIMRLIERQGKYRGLGICEKDLKDRETVEQLLCSANYNQEIPVRYLVPDYFQEEQGDLIAEMFGKLPFLTGGSGLVGALGRCFKKKSTQNCVGNDANQPLPEALKADGKSLLLAGSCSAMTLRQIADYQEKGYPTYRIYPEKLMKEEQSLNEIFRWILNHGSNCLVYSSAYPHELEKSQQLGKEQVAQMLESVISELAKRVVSCGYDRIITAGGETSGAVTKALGYRAFYIGASVAPGVPVMTPVEEPRLRLVLKSGNFGQEDFFERAVEMTGERCYDKRTCQKEPQLSRI